MKIYAIGDIHGNYDLLKKLFMKITEEIQPEDKVVLLGDIIDGGAKTKECIDLILEKSDDYNIIALKGNHEEWMLNTLRDHSKHSWIISMEGLYTIKSYSQTA